MKEKVQKILEKIYEKFTGVWFIDDAVRYVPMLFPFIEPEQNVRNALKALKCKKDKEERFKSSRDFIEGITNIFVKKLIELEPPIEWEGWRYKKGYSEEIEKLEYQDILKMLIPLIALQKSNINVNIDINQLNQIIYSECEKCSIREICKEAVVIVTEYVFHASKELDFQIPKKN